jgi:hypothetical protein
LSACKRRDDHLGALPARPLAAFRGKFPAFAQVIFADPLSDVVFRPL